MIPREAGEGGDARPRSVAALRIAFLPASLAIIVTAALVVPLPVFIETPRDPVSLNERVVVDGGGDALEGDYLLLAVSLRRGTFARMLVAWIDDDRSIIADARIVPPHEDDDAFFARQRDVFSETAVVAAALGLAAAGFVVDPERVTGEGVLVVDVVAGTPAEGGLEPGDVIVEAEGTPVRAFEDLRDVLPRDIGSRVELVVRRDGRRERIALETAELETSDGRRPGIGIVGQTHEPRTDLPVPVEVDAGRIGGPSAGLMIALTVFDKAEGTVDLAAGRVIAGTGRLAREGQVGGVGGVRQKVIAAEAAGVDVLLVPARAADIAEAARRPGSGLEIIPVETLTGALEALGAGGGPTASASVT
jgi:Lon-like protease